MFRGIEGRFVGWFINFPALPNSVSVFYRLTHGLCTASFMLQGLVFLVAWFLCVGSVCCTLYGQSCNQLSMLGPICKVACFKVYSVANFEIWWGAVCCLLGMFELIFILSLLSYGKCKVM